MNVSALGTQVQLVDGREGTVVFNGLIGVGIKWGLHNPNLADFEGSDGNTTLGNDPVDWPWYPDALLRTHPVGVLDGMECVGEDYIILRQGLGA